MEIIEHKIGETFCLEDGTKLQIVKATCNCKDCYFFNSKNNICSRTKDIICSAPRRKDKEFVIFKQVKDNNMEEKRNIQISLEEAREWYNSGDSFKKELALKAYKKEELELSYFNILHKLPYDITRKNALKGDMYLKLINIADYLNNITSTERNSKTNNTILYYISEINSINPIYSDLAYKGFVINKTNYVYPHSCIITFNSKEAAKKAIDILGDELNVLFE